MTRTTPPRPVDVLARVPELGGLARPAVRLHPRAGAPGVEDSSVGGPLLWPRDEVWPVCPGPHVSDAAFAVFPLGAQATDDVPNAMIPLAQVFGRDLPGGGPELLQVLWCPIDHPGTYVPEVRVIWRAIPEEALATAPPAPRRTAADYVPEPCVLHPEAVTELPAPLELPAHLREALGSPQYQYELSVAPGWKLGGWAPWSFSDPFPIICDRCPATMVPLLTIASGEWDGGSHSWRPAEDQDTPYNPPGITVGRGDHLQVYVCPEDRSIQTNLQ